MRKSEYFDYPKMIAVSNNAAMFPRRLYNQELDWSCSISCIRSMLSSYEDIKSDEEIISRYNITPGPVYSKDIKNLGILGNYEVVYGCDMESNDYDITFLYSLLERGFYVMVESMLCFDHWMVLCAYLPNNTDLSEKQYLLLYDPYYGELKRINVDEFESVWMSGEYALNNITKDFIAIKGKEVEKQ